MPHDLYRQGLLELLAETMKELPQGTEKEHHDQLWKKAKDVEEYFATLFDNWFASNYPLMELLQKGPHDVTVRRKTRPSARHANALKGAQKTTLKQQLANFLLTKQILSTAQFMEDSTSRDVRRESSYFEAVSRTVAKKGGALAHVGKHLKEQDLKNIRERYFKSDSSRASASENSAEKRPTV